MPKLPRKEQLKALDIALEHVTDWTQAIDGGANRGDWTERMAQDFSMVHAFEPAKDMQKALYVRFANALNVAIYDAALWNEVSTVSIMEDRKRVGQTRARYVQPGGKISAVTIDGLRLTGCGLIKLDLEGAEMLALQGAQETIAKFKPILIVECKAFRDRFGPGTHLTEGYINELGAREIAAHGPDKIFGW